MTHMSSPYKYVWLCMYVYIIDICNININIHPSQSLLINVDVINSEVEKSETLSQNVKIDMFKINNRNIYKHIEHI